MTVHDLTLVQSNAAMDKFNLRQKICCHFMMFVITFNHIHLFSESYLL